MTWENYPTRGRGVTAKSNILPGNFDGGGGAKEKKMNFPTQFFNFYILGKASKIVQMFKHWYISTGFKNKLSANKMIELVTGI